MDLFFLSLEQVSIAIGAGASFIFCSFFVLSFKNHIVKPFEYTTLKRLSLYATVSAGLALVAFIIQTAFFFESNIDITNTDVSLILFQIILLAVALIGEMTIRKIHLPTLMRHQQTYFHLSDSMVDHQDPLIATVSFSIVSWLFIIFFAGLQFRGFLGSDSFIQPIAPTEQFSFNFSLFLLIYIMIGYSLGKLAIWAKEKLIGRI